MYTSCFTRSRDSALRAPLGGYRVRMQLCACVYAHTYACWNYVDMITIKSDYAHTCASTFMCPRIVAFYAFYALGDHFPQSVPSLKVHHSPCRARVTKHDLVDRLPEPHEKGPRCAGAPTWQYRQVPCPDGGADSALYVYRPVSFPDALTTTCCPRTSVRENPVPRTWATGLAQRHAPVEEDSQLFVRCDPTLGTTSPYTGKQPRAWTVLKHTHACHVMRHTAGPQYP